MCEEFLHRWLSVVDLIPNLLHILNASRSHERVIVSIVEVFQALVPKRFYFIAPGEESWFVVKLACSVIRGGHFFDGFFSKSANIHDDRTDLGVSLPNHCDLNPLFLTIDHANDKVDLLCTNFPVRSKSLLNMSYPKSCFNDLLLKIKASLVHFKSSIHNICSCHVF